MYFVNYSLALMISECETYQSCLKSVCSLYSSTVTATDVDDILHQYEDYADGMIHDLEVKCGITNLQRKRGSNGVWII